MKWVLVGRPMLSNISNGVRPTELEYSCEHLAPLVVASRGAETSQVDTFLLSISSARKRCANKCGKSWYLCYDATPRRGDFRGAADDPLCVGTCGRTRRTRTVCNRCASVCGWSDSKTARTLCHKPYIYAAFHLKHTTACFSWVTSPLLCIENRQKWANSSDSYRNCTSRIDWIDRQDSTEKPKAITQRQGLRWSTASKQNAFKKDWYSDEASGKLWIKQVNH